MREPTESGVPEDGTPPVEPSTAVTSPAEPNTTEPSPAEPGGTSPGDGASFDPTSVIGQWSVTEAGGEPATTVLQLDYELRLWRECGFLNMTYLVNDLGRFIADTTLLDSTYTCLEGDPSDEIPDSLTAPTSEELEGRWLPAVPDPEDPTGSWIEFIPDNRWEGTDGCNGYAGLWLLGSDGQIRATSGISTPMACPGVPVSSWLVEAGAVGLDESWELVFIDVLGTESGRLVRAGGYG